MENFKGVAMDGAKYWQENENNSEWQTDKKHKCSVCGQEADTVLEIKPDEKKAIKAYFKSKIELADSQINGCARKLQSGFEMRSIECNVIRDYEAKTITYIAIDDCRTVDVRPMRQPDLQRPILESERADAIIN